MNKKISLLLMVCMLVSIFALPCATAGDALVDTPIVSIEKTKWAANETVTMSWQHCGDDVMYFLTVYDEAHASVAAMWITKDTSYPVKLSPGNYHIDVSAVLSDEYGKTIEQKDSEDIHVEVGEEKPVASIEKSKWSANETVTMSWVPCEGAPFYHIFAYDEERSSVRIVGMTQNTSYPVNLSAGNYYLQVHAVWSDEYGATTKEIKSDDIFVVVEEEKPVASIEKTKWEENETVTMSWVPCEGADYYSLIAYDENYTTAWPVGMTENTSYPVKLSAGKYYISVSAIWCDEYGHTLKQVDGDDIFVVVELEKPVVSMEKTLWSEHENVKFSWKQCEGVDWYELSFYEKRRDDVIAQGWTEENNYDSHLPKGDYVLTVTGYATDEYADPIETKGSYTIEFTVDPPAHPATYTEFYIVANTYYSDITVYSVKDECEVILALYNGDKLVEMHHQTYKAGDKNIFFPTTQNYTTAKVMLWDDLESMNQLWEAETIIK